MTKSTFTNANGTMTKVFQVGGPGGPRISIGIGSPNSVVPGSPGDLYFSSSGGTGTTLWVKETGINTDIGWNSK